jgi:hypothetical protein
MPHRPDAPDVVIPCRAGENRELRFALRSIEHNFDYRHIWIVGAWPRWLDLSTQHLSAVKRPTRTSKYATTRAHYAWACRRSDVTDPFVLWNDDFFCLRRMHELPALHRGRMEEVLPLYASWQSKWAHGMRETHTLMRRLIKRQTLYCYDLHTPLLVHKAAMVRALELAEAMRITAPHVRTLYGNLQHLGGAAMRDPKIYTHTPGRNPGVWLSSEEKTFAKAVEPQLVTAGLGTPSMFEIPGMPDRAPGLNSARSRDPQSYRHMRYRVLQTPDGNRVMRTPQPAGTRAQTAAELRERRQQILAGHVNDARKGKAGCLSCGRR